MPDLATPIASRLHALLGPTNTGKTHRAIERMLEFERGMMGLPLRLLAREIYDRVSTRVGESRVALVTGEEKRVPKHPAYWICTVESMPRELDVDFVAVDEIQLMAHPTRGHVFTHHLLHTRGIQETWFLGSDTARPLVEQLLPAAKIASHPRLSRLSFAGSHALGRLPRRAAVVAFSLPRVYELAERLRATRGGAAVVLGALSPRTRNAQVAMYQAGEVDYLVATDAIGMGLNLAVDHVAFAGFCKFDGSEERELRPRELGQIAGRAGRHTSPGTFGTLRGGPRMPERVARAIESHRFEPERLAFWRNADLDTSSIDALLQSLAESPRGRLLRRFVDGDDTRALRRLASVAWVADACTREDRVRLLWTVCQVPDYRKLLPELHAELLLEVFKQLLAHDGAMQDAWLEKHVAALDDPRGDVDTLTSRIAAVRTFTYLSQQPGFVANQKAWSERTRAVEDRLSDALHNALIQRFVDRSRRTHVDRGAGFAQLERRLSAMLQRPSDDDWVQAAIAAPSDSIDVLPSGRIEHDGRELARLSAGKSLLLPEVRALAVELPPGPRAQLTRRLVAFSRDLRERLARDWYREDGSAAERGLCYQLLESLGSIERRTVEAQLAALSASEREALQLHGVVVGSRFVWVKALLGRRALVLRSALVAAYAGEPLPDLARAPASLHRPPRLDARWALRLGYAALGPRWVRCDLAERAMSQCVDGSDPGILCGVLGCKKSELKAVVEALAATHVGAKESSATAARLNR